jgi:hypothetical protein
MAVIKSEEREEERVEVDEDDLDLAGLTIPNEVSDQFLTTDPIFTRNPSQPWEENLL